MKFNKFDNRDSKHLSASVLDFAEKTRATINAYEKAIREIERETSANSFTDSLARDMREVLKRKYQEARALLS